MRFESKILALWVAGFVFTAHAADPVCPESVDDGIDCTVDACDETTGNITHTPDHRRCDDANVCTANVCTVRGCRFDPLPVSVMDDGNACTEDLCDPKAGILHRPVTIDDNNVCTADSCEPPAGPQHIYTDNRVETDCSEGIGGCRAEGKWICDPKSGEVSCTAKAGQPQEEVCNQIDDDCDGATDNVARLGEVCTDGKEECLVTGVLECKSDGRLACSTMAGDGSEEKCDGIDNDCDGSVDENLDQGCYDGPGYAVGVGICKEGRQSCSKGDWGVCSGSILPKDEEVCGNRLDDDCDGEVEEGCEVVQDRPLLEEVKEKEILDKTVVTQQPAEVFPEKVLPQEKVVISQKEAPVPEPFIVVQQQPVKKVEPVKAPEAKKLIVEKETVAVKKSEPAKEIQPAPVIKAPEPTKTTEPIAVKEAVPAEKETEKEFAGSCQSDTYDCTKNLVYYLPFLHLDEAFFEDQLLCASGYSGKSGAVLACVNAAEIVPGGPVTFRSFSLTERWMQISWAAIDGEKKDDLVVLAASGQYGALLNAAETLAGHDPKAPLVLEPFDPEKDPEEKLPPEEGSVEAGLACESFSAGIYSDGAIHLSPPAHPLAFAGVKEGTAGLAAFCDVEDVKTATKVGTVVTFFFKKN